MSCENTSGPANGSTSTSTSTGSNPWPQLEQFFTFIESRENILKFECVQCRPRNNILSTSMRSSYNLTRHILRKHRDVFKTYQNCATNGKCPAVRSATKGPSMLEMLKNSADSFHTEEKVLNFFVENMLSFEIIESNSWKELATLHATNHSAISRRVLIRRIEEKFQRKKDELKTTLCSVPTVATTVDLWTCGRRTFLGMTAHWIDQNTLVRKRAVLACKRIFGAHTYDNLAKNISMIHREFAIEEKVCRIVTDNGANFIKPFSKIGTKATEDLSGLDELDAANSNENEDFMVDLTKMEDDNREDCSDVIQVIELENIFNSFCEDIKREPGEEQKEYVVPKHMKCATHDLNLIATSDASDALKQSALYKKSYQSAFAKVSQLWNKQSQSLLASDTIKKELGILLVVPCVTRWNSIYDAIRKVAKFFDDAEKIIALCRLCTIFGLPLFSANDMVFLKEYTEVMKPIAEALYELQREDGEYMGALLPYLAAAEHLLSGMEELTICQPLLSAVKSGMEKRFGHLFVDMDFLAATVVHPRFKFSWMKLLEGRENVDIPRLKAIIKQELVNMLKCFVVEGDLGEDVDNGAGEDRTFCKILDGSPRVQKTEMQILEAFLDECTSKSLCAEVFGNPLLKKLFVNLNTPLPSSASVEQFFSLGKEVLRSKRTSLSDDHFEALVFLKGYM